MKFRQTPYFAVKWRKITVKMVFGLTPVRPFFRSSVRALSFFACVSEAERASATEIGIRLTVITS
jgi:hypothetical protein